MEVEKEKTGPCQYKLTIKVEPERLRQPLRRAAQQISKRRPIAGFRPGRAPYAMVERVYGQEVIVDEMLAEVGNELYQEALEQSQIEPYTRAGFEIVQVDPLILEVTVPAEPEVTLGEYATIRVTQEQPSVTETEVEEVLSQLQDDQALWVPVERAIQMADQVQIDALGTTDDGRKVEQPDLTLEISEGMVPSGFGEQLLGIKPGESKEFDVDYPADFRDENVAGKTVHFQVTVKSVKEKELPALDDQLAQSLGQHETLDELRADIWEKLQQRKETEAKDEAIEEALSALAEQATVEYPAVAVEREIDAMQQTLSDRLEQRGFTLEGFLHTSGKSLTQWREETRPQAEMRLKRALVLGEFAKAEGIKVEAGEIQEEVDRLSQSFGERSNEVKAALSTGQPLLSITNDVYSRKAVEHLWSLATGQSDAAAEAKKKKPSAAAKKTKRKAKKAAAQNASNKGEKRDE